MATQALYLDEDDDIVSIRDRLDWAREQRVVLVLPDQGDVLTSYLDLTLLRRYADDLRLEVGLVTNDSRVAGPAKTLGFPTFRSLKEGQKSRRGWWRSRRALEKTGHPIHLEKEDRAEIERRKRERPDWQRWLIRYLATITYILTLAFLFVVAVYAVPGAVITFQPQMRDITVNPQIVADPLLESADSSGSSVPGRVLRTVQEWQAEVRTTGSVEVPDSPARGNVVFVNQIDRPVTVPAGTRVSTSAGQSVVFQTLESVTVPEGPGTSSETEIVAIEPGLSGNVEANLINRIEGSLALQLQVRNLEPLDGGSVRQEPAVSEADVDRLRAQVIDQIDALALAEMTGMLNEDEFLAADSMRIINLLHETYSHFPGERTTSLALEMRAALEATAVDETQAVEFVYNELAASIPPGFEIVPESLHFRGGDVIGVDSEGRVTFEMIGEGRIAARLDLEGPTELIAGQEVGHAQAFLFETLPLRDYPEIEIWPRWFNRVPYLPIRVQNVVDT